MTEQEKKHAQHEHQDNSERLTEIADKRRESIQSKLDKAERDHHERRGEQDALAKATELAKEAQSTHRNEDQSTSSPHERRAGAPSKKQLKESFDAEMKGVRSEMDPASRLFSKFVHMPVIEKSSEVIGSTIARPSAMLGGAIAAFLSITILYFIAHYYGYQLSGFETIAAFVVGWIIGILYDYFSVTIRGRNP